MKFKEAIEFLKERQPEDYQWEQEGYGEIITLLKQLYKKHMKWLKDYLYQLYKDEVISSDQLYDMSLVFGFKDDYDYGIRRKR